MKKIAIITARSGSKGLPNKNILLLNGKPLICYTIDAALEAGVFEKIIVSTDSEEYIDLLSHYPIEFVRRSEELSGDTVSSFLVIEDVLKRYRDLDYDYFVLLQPTSPLRTAQHILEACQKFEDNFDRFDFSASVSHAGKSTTLTKQVDEDESMKYFDLDYSNYARQKCHPEYSPNGAFFIAKPKEYLEHKHFYGPRSICYFMPKDVSIDVDDRLDFEFLHTMLQKIHREETQLHTAKRYIKYLRRAFDEKTDAGITFLGHSILGDWDIEQLAGAKVRNLGVPTITAKLYLELILKPRLIKHFTSERVILMFGTNEITQEGWSPKAVCEELQAVIDEVKRQNPSAHIYTLGLTPTAIRVDRNNKDVLELNTYLSTHLHGTTWIELYKDFTDKYGKLDLRYSNDGVHLNGEGYKLLEKLVTERL